MNSSSPRFHGIIHVAGIGLAWRSSERSIRLSVRNALRLASELGYHSVAFPLIGAGTGGFETILHFIEVPSADFAVERVRERVKQGGHPIPEDAIRRRYDRGLELFSRAYRPLFDLWYYWKSDEQGLELVARKGAGG